MQIAKTDLDNLNLTVDDLVWGKGTWDEKIKVRLLKFLTMPQKIIVSFNPSILEKNKNIQKIQNLFGSSTNIENKYYLTKNLFKNIIKSVDNNAFDGDTLQIRFTCHQDYDENGYQNNNSTSTDMVEETLTFNLTPRSAVLIPKTTSEYTGQGTPKTATFNAKIHIVDASSTSEIYLKIKNNSNNPVTTTISNVTYPTTTQINGGQEKEVLIDNANKNKYIKTNIGIKFEYPDKSEITIWVFYNKYNKETKKAESIYLPDEGVTIQLK